MKKALIYVLAILILCAILAKNKYKRLPPKGISTTKANLKYLHVAVKQFKADTGRFPTNEEGLKVLIEQPKDVENWRAGGYIESIELPKDRWRNDFIYRAAPDGNEPFVIKSLGADGKEGGRGKDADLFSTDAK